MIRRSRCRPRRLDDRASLPASYRRGIDCRITLCRNDLQRFRSDNFDRYQGALLALPNVGVRKHFFLEEESFSYGLADFLTGVYPDRMESHAEGQNAEIRLIFSG